MASTTIRALNTLKANIMKSISIHLNLNVNTPVYHNLHTTIRDENLTAVGFQPLDAEVRVLFTQSKLTEKSTSHIAP